MCATIIIIIIVIIIGPAEELNKTMVGSWAGVDLTAGEPAQVLES